VTAFEPGGHCVMVFGVRPPPATGSTITVVLTFERAGEIEVEAEVRNALDGGTGPDDASPSCPVCTRHSPGPGR
jgi:copper(I)-binding protein